MLHEKTVHHVFGSPALSWSHLYYLCFTVRHAFDERLTTISTCKIRFCFTVTVSYSLISCAARLLFRPGESRMARPLFSTTLPFRSQPALFISIFKSCIL